MGEVQNLALTAPEAFRALKLLSIMFAKPDIEQIEGFFAGFLAASDFLGAVCADVHELDLAALKEADIHDDFKNLLIILTGTFFELQSRLEKARKHLDFNSEFLKKADSPREFLLTILKEFLTENSSRVRVEPVFGNVSKRVN